MAKFKKREHKFPEEIEMLGLTDVLARSHPRDRVVPGIYFLIDGNEVVYVGQSMNLPMRIHQHRLKDEKKFDRFTVYPCDKALLDRLEGHYIARFSPRYNTMRKFTATSMNAREAHQALLIQRGVTGVTAAVPPELHQEHAGSDVST